MSVWYHDQTGNLTDMFVPISPGNLFTWPLSDDTKIPDNRKFYKNGEKKNIFNRIYIILV